MIINQSQVDNAKVRDLVDVECDYCHNLYQKTKRGLKKYHYCSKECQSKGQISKVKVNCLQCSIEFYKNYSQSIKFPNHFCGHSCRATHQNKHKKTGFRRSKAEVFLEELIKLEFPHHTVRISVRDILPDGLEVDILLPDLNIAIELNGPVHYFPIYGQEKLNKITDNDIRKQVYLQQAGFNLIVLNISTLKHWKTSQLKIKEMYDKLIKPLL